MLLPVFLHLVRDEVECAIDDLLVKLQLFFLLVKVLRGSLDLDRIEVKQLVLLLKDFEKTLDLNPLVQDEVLNIPRSSNLLLIAFFLLLHLCLNFVNVLVVGPDAKLCLLLLFCDGFLDFLLLPSRLCNLLVKLSNSSHVVGVLVFLQLNDLVFLQNCAFKVLVLLLVNDIGHALHLPDIHRGGLEPLHI